jgi:DNA processing protein
MQPRDERGFLALAVDSLRVRSRAKRALFAALARAGDVARLSAQDARSIAMEKLEGWDARRAEADAERAAKAMEATGCGFSIEGEDSYPAPLAEIYDPPFILYSRGRAPSGPTVAIVGTRKPSGDGLAEAARLAKSLSAIGAHVVSGLARGIDAAAHRGALEAERPTWAVLGCGIDAVYPKAHARLAARMMESGGGLLSEYGPGVPPAKWRFPARNRLIAGLCAATVVVEAPAGSGALITAAFAADEGRDVLVAAALLGRRGNEGCDCLARDGALALRDAADVFAPRNDIDGIGFGRTTVGATT